MIKSPVADAVVDDEPVAVAVVTAATANAHWSDIVRIVGIQSRCNGENVRMTQLFAVHKMMRRRDNISSC
jgi:hypothetical protein